MGARDSLVSGLVAALSGLLGVVVGTIVSGHYQLESQRIIAQQSENMAQYETSRVAAQALVKVAAQYFSELSYLATLAKTPEKINNLDEHMQSLYRSGFELSLQTTIPTAQKVLESNVYISEIMAAAHEPERLRTLEAKSKVLGETYLSIYTDVARFRVTSGPTVGRDELLTSVLQLLVRQ
jgi:hypothetical protein